MTPAPAVANGIVQEMRDSRQSQTWRKVTTILSAYDAYRLTEALRDRIDCDFASAGLKLTPPMHDVTRDGRLRISMSGTHAPPGDPADGGSMPKGVTLWTRRDTGWEPIPSLAAATSAVIVDIDLSLGDHDGLVQSLPGCLTGLDAGVVTDLLEPDRHAEFKVAKPSAATSRASLFVARVEDGESASQDKAVQLSMGMVEFAVGDKWLITARHPPSTYLSGSPADSGQRAPGADRYLESLMEYGLADATTSSAAALTVINQGVDSFSRARDVLASYLESWRTDFAMGSRDKSLLSDLQATLPLVVSALEPLRKPTVVRWTAGRLRVEAKDLSDQIARNYEALQDLQGTVSAAVAQADQAKNEDYQRSLATLAAVLLAPALVASIFGANTVLEDSPLDLVWLLLAMVVAGGVTQLLIMKRFGPRTRTPASPRPARSGLPTTRTRNSPSGGRTKPVGDVIAKHPLTEAVVR